MAIVKELKNLGKKMTGSDLTGNTVSEALKAIEEKYTGGGSSVTYETVAEIEVGEMVEDDGHYYTQTDIPFPTVSESETYYLNTKDNPNDGFVSNDGSVSAILWNCTHSEETLVPIDPDRPYVVFTYIDGKIVLMSDTNDLENTTVRILKKASAPSGGNLPEVTAADNGKVLTVVDGAWAAAISDTYKTVAEYALGNEITGHQIQNGHLWIVTLSDEDAAAVFDAVEGGADLYFNSPDMPLDEKPEGVEEQSESVILCNNATIENGTITGLTEPGCAFGVMYSNNTYVAEIVSTDDLSNTTLKILKKASASSNSDRLVVTLTKTGEGSEAVYSADKSYHKIKAALDAKKDVEVLYPHDFDGALTDPLIVHLFPLGYQAINETVSLIGFTSLPTYSEVGFSSASVTCQYNSTTDATTWNVAWNGIAQSKEFAFTATPDGQGGFTVTAGDDVTYAAILSAMESSMTLVSANISVPALEKTVIAQFNAKSSNSGNGVVSASIVGYVNSAWCIMELYVRSDGTKGVDVVPIPTQS